MIEPAMTVTVANVGRDTLAIDRTSGEVFNLVELLLHVNALEEQVDVLQRMIGNVRGLNLADGRPIEDVMGNPCDISGCACRRALLAAPVPVAPPEPDDRLVDFLTDVADGAKLEDATQKLAVRLGYVMTKARAPEPEKSTDDTIDRLAAAYYELYKLAGFFNGTYNDLDKAVAALAPSVAALLAAKAA